MTPPAAMLILHVFPSFAVGGAQMRMATLANRFGARFRHAIVALDRQAGCRSHLDPGLDVTFIDPPAPAPSLPGRLRRIRAVLREIGPDLLITSNWGSIEWAMARPLAGIRRHIHTEDGFGPEERQSQLRRRVLTRRIALRRSEVVVPSATLNDIARQVWRLPPQRLHYIANGIDLERFHPAAPVRIEGSGLTVLCVAGLRPEKNLGRLLRALALADLTPRPRLLIAGDGPEGAALRDLAARLSLDVEFLGDVADPAPLYRAADLFALSSDTEQMPLSVIEAMASGLPVIATAVGDIRAMVAEPNHGLLTDRSDDALAGAFRAAGAMDGSVIGTANRRRAEMLFDVARMTADWLGLLAPNGAFRSR